MMRVILKNGRGKVVSRMGVESACRLIFQVLISVEQKELQLNRLILLQDVGVNTDVCAHV